MAPGPVECLPAAAFSAARYEVPTVVKVESLRVRNTFIDTCCERSPSLERFFEERKVRTCPCSPAGKEEEIAQVEEQCRAWQKASEDAEESPCSTYAPSACSVEGPLRFGDSPAASASAHSPPAAAAFSGLPQHPPAFAPPDQGAPLPPLHPPIAAAAIPFVPPPPAGPAPGSAELPSVGSAGHSRGECKPCAFFHTAGCSNGICCKFCHLCDAGEKKRRRRQKLETMRGERKSKEGARSGGAAASQQEECSADSDV